MEECFIIPDGEHLQFYRQFGKYNRIEPVKLKDGSWALPVRIVPHLQRTYTSIVPNSKRFNKRKDVSVAVISYADNTISDLNRYPKRKISSKDLPDNKVGVNGRRGLLQFLGLRP